MRSDKIVSSDRILVRCVTEKKERKKERKKELAEKLSLFVVVFSITRFRRVVSLL